MKSRLLLFVLGTLGIIFFAWVFLSSLNTSKKPGQVATPSPTISGAVPNNYFWTQKTKEASKKSYAVGQLIDKLPYKGANFSISYDINNDIFILVLNQNNAMLANKEFDNFLLQNNIKDRSWISNLVVRQEALRP